jgi:putative oxidoreductase
MMDTGLLIIRLIIGLTFATHDTQKLFGWFGGHGNAGTGDWFESIGMKPGKALAITAGLAELIGGLLFAGGVFLWIAAILIIGSMLVAIVKVHGANGYWVTQNGYEYKMELIVIALGVAMIGAGDYSLAALIG